MKEVSNPTRVIRSAIVGTSFMTAFSYIFSKLTHNNAKEPELLGKMIGRITPMSKPASFAAGWIAHYGVGLLFAESYGQIWERTALEPTAKTGLVFGGLSGIAAILIWKFIFKIHPLPPATNFKNFSVNLFLAHLVFGLFAAISWNECSELSKL